MIAGYLQEAFAPIGFPKVYCLLVLVGHVYGFPLVLLGQIYGFAVMVLFSRKAKDHQVNVGNREAKSHPPSDRQRLIVEV